jgi:hypothetical protein
MTDNETNEESSTGTGDNIPSALDEHLIAQLHDDARAAAEGKPVVRHYIQRQAPESQS